MSNYDDEYDDDNGGYDDYDTEEAIRFIRSKLDKSVKIADDFILTKLELCDWDENKALKAIKASLPKPAGSVAKPANSGAAVASSKNNVKQASNASTNSKPSSTSTETQVAPVVDKPTVFEVVEDDIAAIPKKVIPVEIQTADISDDEEIGTAVNPDNTTAHHKPELTMIVVGHVDAGES